MITLALDASVYRGSVAVLEGDRVLVGVTTEMRGRDVERMMPAVDSALRDAGIGYGAIGRIVCGSGPGSFTSLRIAASIAKGMASALAIPLHSVSSLALLVAANVADGPRGPRRYLAALDALRGESYAALFEHDAGAIRTLGGTSVVRSEELRAQAEKEGARLVGPEQADAWRPHAKGVALLAPALAVSQPVDLGSWEPDYGRKAEAQVKWELESGRPLPR